MLEQISPLWPAFKKARDQQMPLVLATLVRVDGSSYKKPGAMMLIEADKTTHGLLSGGCLEADIAEHAESLFANGDAKILTYDLSDDSLFGLGAGCDGTIDILLQALTDDYQPFDALNPEPGSATDTRLRLLTRSSSAAPVGAWQISNHNHTTDSHSNADFSSPDVVSLDYHKPPAVLVMGAGFDAIPLCQLLLFQHWHTYLLDHRSGRLNNQDHDHRLTLLHHQSNTAPLPGIDFDAAIIMSHNLDQDAAYLQLVNQRKTPFIGLLGPVARRDKVLKLAGLTLTDLQGRLHAPVGLSLGGRLPENIAVSVVAQLQAVFYQP